MTIKKIAHKRPAMTPAELKTVRADLGLTQAEMADRCGCSLNAIKQYETGKRPIPEMLRKLTYYLLAEHEKRN